MTIFLRALPALMVLACGLAGYFLSVMSAWFVSLALALAMLAYLKYGQNIVLTAFGPMLAMIAAGFGAAIGHFLATGAALNFTLNPLSVGFMLALAGALLVMTWDLWPQAGEHVGKSKPSH